jgi:hypothetical protein
MKPNTFYENDLITATDVAIANESALLEVGASTGFLPRIQLFGGSSDAVKEGKINVGRYGLVRGKDQLEDLGPEVDVLVCAGRVKALDISTDTPITSYDHKSDLFKDIAAGSAEENSRKMFGPEYLVWVPSCKQLATFFLSSPTARRESGSIHARLRKAATLKAKLIVGKKFKWHGPQIVPCSTPFELPDVDFLNEEIAKFVNPKSSEVEIASTTEERAR